MSSDPKTRLRALPLAVLAFTIFFLAASSASPNPNRAGPQKKPHPTRIPNHYLVGLKSSVRDPGAVAARQERAYGAQVTHVYRSALKGYAAKIPEDRVAALRANPNVRFVSPDLKIGIAGQADGTGVERIRAMNKVNKGAGINVAVIDTGIDLNHPDLAANIAGGTNCSTGGKRGYNDGHGHGTHVAGIIAALDNGIGVVGVAPAAKLWAVRVLNDSGVGSTSDVVCGIDFVDSKSPAKGGPISVANMSLGGLGSDDGNCGKTNGDALHQAICRAVGDGVTFVVAAGNSGLNLSQSTTIVPAAYEEVITVSALSDSNGQPCGSSTSTTYGGDDDFASFSDFATSATDLNHMIGAPGVGIYSTWLGGGYSTLSGTSMASPHVAGAAALYLADHPGASPASVLAGLKALGEPANTNFNGECGSTSKRGMRVSHTDSMREHPEAVLRADTL